MKVNILSDGGSMREVNMSGAMRAHFGIHINHAHTILEQINSGMYREWFDGKKDLVCMDFGANVGLVSLYMLPFCKELYCIEPTPSHFDLMQELLSANKGDTQLMLSPYALTEKEGEVTFATGHSTENKVSSPDGYGNHKITVMGKPLSWFVADKVVDFCKIDIESGEMLALTVDELQKVHGSVKVFFVEVHPGYNGGMDENREELIRRFTESGYKTETKDFQTIVAYAS